MNYPLSRKVKEVLENTRSENFERNFGLRFLRLQETPSGNNEKTDKEKYKRDWKPLVEDSANIYRQDSMKKILAGLHARLDRLESSLKSQNFASFYPPFVLKVDWRFVIGLGNPSVLDTGIRLHSIYGFPYLPGQGLKGAMRHSWMLTVADTLGVPRFTPKAIKKRHKTERTPWEKFEDLLINANPKNKILFKDKFQNLKDDKAVTASGGIKSLTFTKFWERYAVFYQKVFGSANAQGKVIFLDVLLAFEEERPIVELEVDIINPHYGEYYTSEGATPPADYLSPKPVFFLTIRRDTPFRFRVLSKDKNLLGDIRSLIEETARDFGLGAKTMSGYGELY